MNHSSLFRAGGTAALAVLIGLVATFLAYGVTQEIPVGNLTGEVIMSENGKPLANAAVILRPKSNDDLGSARVRFIRADKNGKFSLRNLPSAVYEVEVSANAHQLPRMTINVEEGKSKVVQLKLDPMDPYLTLYANQHVFMPKEEPNVQVHGFVQAKTLNVQIYDVSVDRLMQEKDFYRAFSPIAQAQTPNIVSGQVPGAKMVQQFDWPIQPDDAEGTFKKTLALPHLKPGFYFVRLRSEQNKFHPETQKADVLSVIRGTYLLVTDLGIVAKRAKGKLHVFASNLETGVPVAGVPVVLAQHESSRSLGTTSSDGTLTADLAEAEINTSVASAVVARNGESNAVITFNDYSGNPEGMRFFIQTDRPIYRPGDHVYFRAIARKPSGAAYSMPSETTATFEVQDMNSRVLKKSEVPLTSFGTFSGDFTLPEGSTEAVRLIVNVGGKEDERSIYVAAYRKPEFKITATPVKDFYLRGDSVQMKVKCEYYFGGPVVGAKIDSSINKSPLWSWTNPDTGEEESYDDEWGGEYVGEASGVTDANGEILLTFESRDLKWGTYENIDQKLTFNISGSEGDDRYFEGKGSVKLLQGDITIRTDQDRWVVEPGNEAEISFQLSTPDFGSNAIANREITVETGYEVWDGKGSVFTPEGKTTVTTDKTGRAVLKVKPQNPGDFRIRASSTDRRGKVIQSSAWIWCYRDGFDFQGPSPDLQIVLDKKSYLPGDTVQALIRSKNRGGSAWVTLETDGIVAEKVVALTGGMTTVEFPVTENLKPNAFVSVSLIKDKQYSSAQRRLTVKLTRELLKVKVTSDRAVYKPGETATYTVQASHFDGSPARTEVALGVVDEAIYAIAEDTDDPSETFYPIRSSLINTFNSFPELYLDGGEKGATDVDVRTNFVDTATWTPHLMTDAQGKASITVKLPDNLTSWRATATAVTEDTSVGKGVSNLIVKKELMVRLATPMFLTQLDKTTLTANINNGTNEPIDVKVRLKATLATVTDAAEKSVRVEPNKSAQASWQIELPEAGDAQFEVLAMGLGDLNDGMRVTVPVKVHGRIEVTGQAGELSQPETSVTVNLDPTARIGSLKLSASPTLIAPLLGSVESLVDFPYGCSEQTTSRFVPATVARQLMRELKVSKPELEAKIDKVTRLSLERLKLLQSSDGGWGWFEHDTALPWTTAVVLDGMARANQAGIKVDGIVLNNGIDWAKRWLLSKSAKDARIEDKIKLAAAVLKFQPAPEAIAVLKSAPLSWAVEGVKDPAKLDTESLCRIVLGLAQQTDSASTTKRMVTLQELWDRAQVRQDSIFWKDYWGAGNTALALEAVMQETPNDARIPKIVRGLLLLRKGDRWQSTMDSALAIQALVPYVRMTGGGSEDGSLEVIVNGKSVASRTGNEPLVESEIPLSRLKPGANTVVFRRTGAGVGFYNVTMSQTPLRREFSAVGDAGLSIERTFHTLAAERMEDGSMQLRPSKNSQTRFVSGEPVRCIVKISAKKPLAYAMIEIPLPSNMKLSVNDQVDNWDFWYTGMSVLDDKIVFFAPTIAEGTSELEFNLRAEAAGFAGVLPAQVIEMYAPDKQASTTGLKVEVTK